MPEDLGGQSDFRGHAIADQNRAAVSNVVRLKRRSEFLAVAATGRRWVAPAFVLQIGPRGGRGQDILSDEIGLGFTATKRIGNAVARNRAKRRLREAARQLLPHAANAAHDYVLIARTGVLTCAFPTLLGDLKEAFSKVLSARPRPSGRSKPAGRQETRVSARAPKTPSSSNS
ncbi:MAG: ribonuclease P protein component [Geminicoccaceae bacterium]